jgi:uncharacterized protein (TIGR00730 family)
MPKNLRRAPKAYKNLQFLNGPDAVTIRILSEFLEPMSRFQREGIKNTIVFFGSARFLSREMASKKLKLFQSNLKGRKNLTLRDKTKLEKLQTDLRTSIYYEDAVRLSSLLTKWSQRIKPANRYVICSGGGPGIMEAANRGAYEAGGRSIGLNISLPMEQYTNAYITPTLNFEFHYFFMRKLWFMYLADALVMFPGGYGTMDELMEVLTLLQTRKVKKVIPVILYGTKYWSEVINFEALLRHRTILKRDLKLFRFADSPDEAYQFLRSELTLLARTQKESRPITLSK